MTQLVHYTPNIKISSMKRRFCMQMLRLITLVLPVNPHLLPGNAGPDYWHLNFPHCGGHSQSPVSIRSSEVILDSHKLGPFKMKGYNSTGDLPMDLENNGHTIQINLQGKGISITGGGLGNAYIANQFHFHWGKTDKRGSEHAINGKYFPMEMHIVHYNMKHKNFSQALDKKDGLAVLSFFFKVGKYNVNLNPIITHFQEIPHRDDHTKISKIVLRNLLPKKLNGYFRYYGSLTTPPCHESVIWSIFYEPVNISAKQLQAFRNKVHQNVANETNRDISDDYRPLQPLNQRKIYCSKEYD
ncbi:hypothetical protein CHS0354_039318 [Potamilus streckersoni]|uniref:Carbonic anhydrase n=1 Tax=Potamilus streckersoni TaxID=2493646 RepID=A0AAE0WD03_9BIVA|nr:hypothetical protein CHS0354_039318 [Potamilus streckersoni]